MAQGSSASLSVLVQEWRVIVPLAQKKAAVYPAHHTSLGKHSIKSHRCLRKQNIPGDSLLVSCSNAGPMLCTFTVM